MLWALLAPIGAILIYGARESIPWFVAYVVLATVSGVFDYYLASELPKNVTYFMRQREKLQAELHEKHLLLQEDQAQIERLLLNILPAPIAKRLQASSNTIADGFSDVTVMFVDIKDFTRLSGDQPPIVIVESLNRVFSYFDGLVEKYDLEKIKTIGDAYMVAGGLSLPPGWAFSADGLKHTHAMLGMALEILD